MGFFKQFFTIGGGEQIAKPIEALGGLLDGVFTSDEERLDRQIVMERIRTSPYLATLQIALKDAQSGDAFTRRARPMLIYGFVFIAVMQLSILPTFWWLTQSFIDPSIAPPPAVASTADIMAVMSAAVAGVFTYGRTQERLNREK